ncbi:MAG TPA: choice-of-anchor B family protein [Rhodothermales bacterium]|nr:choice-of-anchor B family protein [Rhodothermales bacterium]
MMRRVKTTFFLVLLLGICANVQAQQANLATKFSETTTQQLAAVTSARQACVDGTAGGFSCSNVDLLAFLPLSTFSSGSANDIWGWTDPQNGNEYALIGLNNGTGFVDISDPENPVYLGKLPTHTGNSDWRDVKVYANHAFIVSDVTANAHGVQVFDLTQLRNVANPPVTFSETAHYDEVNEVHNIVINEDTGFAYTVGNQDGGATCAGGLHMIDIQDPLNPTFAGCFSTDGYTHDAQCVVYNGPDIEHQGKEICFASNEDTVTIVDVTDKSNPQQLSRMGYPTSGYIHQGWLTEDQIYFYQNDELDEWFGTVDFTRTLIWDVSDLDDPMPVSEYNATLESIDHNLYTVGDLLYEANYTTGLRILDISDRENPVEVAFFDTYTLHDGASFSGAWSNYPYFESGVVVVSSIGEGLFILEPQLFMPVMRFVATTGNDSGNDCTDELTPCATLQHAMDEARSGDIIDLATGTYSGAGLLIEKTVTLRGAGVVVE